MCTPDTHSIQCCDTNNGLTFKTIWTLNHIKSGREKQTNKLWFGNISNFFTFSFTQQAANTPPFNSSQLNFILFFNFENFNFSLSKTFSIKYGWSLLWALFSTYLFFFFFGSFRSGYQTWCHVYWSVKLLKNWNFKTCWKMPISIE